MDLAPRMEVRTRSVERALEPLVAQVSTLINGYESAQNTPSHSAGGGAGDDRKSFSYHSSSTNSSPSIKMSKGKSKRAQVLVATVEQAIRNFVLKGEEIAHENEDMREEMLTAVNNIRVAGSALHRSAKNFADNPIAADRRAVMVNDARTLLSAVTRLLIVADMIDVNKLMQALRVVENDIESMRNVENHQTLMEQYQQYGSHVEDLGHEAARRQYELMDGRMRDDIASARATLNRNKSILLTSSRAYVRHPEVAAAKENRDFVLQQVTDAVSTIHDVARGQAPTATGLSAYDEPGELSAALDEFDERIIMQPHEYHQVHSRDMLEKQLESIITGAALVADMSSTRDDRRERIIAECNAVRQALQELLNEYINSTTGAGGKRQKSGTTREALEQAIAEMTRRTRDLRRQLRKAIVDHVSDSFLESNVPLVVLIEAARAGDEAEVETYGAVFEEHARKLVEVAHLACSMSEQEDGVKMVRYAAAQVEALFPQVINAARLLCARPKSKVTLENMDAFRVAWENQVRILTDAVDDITTLDDFLAVSESHILDDINRCIVAATQEGDAEVVDRTAGAIRGRCVRMCAVVDAEMENFERGPYTAHVSDVVKRMRGHVLPVFTQQIDYVVQKLTQQQPNVLAPDDLNDFVGATRLVFECARELRRAVLSNRSADEVAAALAEEDEDLAYAMQRQQLGNTDEYFGELEEPTASLERAAVSSPTHESIATTTGTSATDATDAINEQHPMRSLPADERQKIAAQVEVFKIEKTKFDREISKWDDTGNDIIIMAKCMCMIMMEMTDFTRGRGPLKTTGHVIKAAQRISQQGKHLNQQARLIAQQCPESTTKQDLLAYLDKITLFCHQLEITSKVKADVQNIGGEQVVSALEGATSLITAAKNLMNAVVLTVKSSFVASTKYSNRPLQQQQQQRSGPSVPKLKDPPGVMSMTSAMASGVFPSAAASTASTSTAASGQMVADPVPVVVWKMKAPEKKPLIKNDAEKADSSSGGGVVNYTASSVRRGSLKKSIPPIRELADFVDK